MMTIKVLPNKSIKEAIILSLSKIEPTSFSSVQLINNSHFRIKSKTGAVYEITISKIRIGTEKGKWVISELNMAKRGENVPKRFKGDYELIDDFDALIYGE